MLYSSERAGGCSPKSFHALRYNARANFSFWIIGQIRQGVNRPAERLVVKILTASQMAEVDRRTSEIHHIPTLLLMENAGRAVIDALELARPGLYSSRIHVLCGKGN